MGLIAQDVPDKLAAFCRKRTHVELHSGDKELTEIFILDHSCVPFVCINAIKKHEEQIESFRMRVRTPGRRLPGNSCSGCRRRRSNDSHLRRPQAKLTGPS